MKRKLLAVFFVICGAIISFAAINAYIKISDKPELAKYIFSNTSISQFREINKCAGINTTEKQLCLDNFIKAFAEDNSLSIPQMLALVEQYRNLDSEIEMNCHPITHSIGRYNYSITKNLGSAFEVCDLTCNSGCFHGVMERLFFNDDELQSGRKHLTAEQMKDKVKDICNQSNFINPTTSVIFQCLHGLGHAILYSLDYQYLEGFKVCDYLESDYEQTSCHGGVAMENVTAFEKLKRDIRIEDPLYPCNKPELTERHKEACYEMQTSIMVEQGYTWQEIADLCLKSELPHNCFLSYGRDISNVVISGDVDTAKKGCEEYAQDNKLACITNTVRTLNDRDKKYAFTYCNALESENQEWCFTILTEYLSYSIGLGESEINLACKELADNPELCISTIL